MSAEKPRGDRIRLTLPAQVSVARIVFHRSENLKGLTPRDFAPAILSWIESHTKDPLLGAIRKFVDDGCLHARILPAANLPFVRNSLPCPECRKHAGIPDIDPFDSCFILCANDSLAPPRPGLWTVLAASCVIAEALEGVLWVQGLGFLPPARAHASELPADGAIAASRHLRFTHSFDAQMRGWVTTSGMANFGLPDLEAIDVPPRLTEAVGQVLCAIAQRLIRDVEATAQQSPGGSFDMELPADIRVSVADLADYRGEAPPSHSAVDTAIRARLVLSRAADGRPRFLRFSPPEDFREFAGVFFYQVRNALLPRGSQRILAAKADRAALIRASEMAIARLEEIKRRFCEGLGLGVVLFVSHGLRLGDGGVEIVRSAVTAWRGRRIQAILSDEPACSSRLRAGQPIELDQRDVLDWVIEKPDGTWEGGYMMNALLGALGRDGRG